ncbi:MAG: metallophosphoesterase [Pirellulales bacterium]
MLAVTLMSLALAAFGHVAFWIAVDNRWHALGYSRPLTKSVGMLFFAGLVAPLVWLAWQVTQFGWVSLEAYSWQLTPSTLYLGFCAAFGVLHLANWSSVRRLARTLPDATQVDSRWIVNLVERIGSSPARGPRAALFGLVPGNQLCQLHLSEATIRLPGVPPQLAGLSIVHWSDLHLSGRLDRGYYREIVALTNQWQVDVLALTGDVCDKAACIDWIPELFGPAQARLGKFFILGNHDLRTHDTSRLRAVLAEAGFTDLGGQALELENRSLLMAGDERPWFPGEASLPEMPHDGRPPLKILLAHTPDRLAWARARQFDLMLAGHTHGGQIRFPFIGPVVCPSWHGTKYAEGYFYQAPTLMHVSRGTGSLFPLRIGCPPEITRLVMQPIA